MLRILITFFSLPRPNREAAVVPLKTRITNFEFRNIGTASSSSSRSSETQKTEVWGTTNQGTPLLGLKRFIYVGENFSDNGSLLCFGSLSDVTLNMIVAPPKVLKQAPIVSAVFRTIFCQWKYHSYYTSSVDEFTALASYQISYF